jgi:hypothetical protein
MNKMLVINLIQLAYLLSYFTENNCSVVNSLHKNQSYMIVRNNLLRVSVNRKKQFIYIYEKYKEKMKRYRTSWVSLYYDCIYGYYTLSDEQFTVIEEIIYNVLLS